MNRRQLLAISGGILLVIGVFSPIAEVLWVTINYYLGGEGDGVIVLILAAIAMPLLLTERFPKTAWIPVVLIGAILVYDFFNLQSNTQGFASLGWGWFPLFTGEALFIAAAATRHPEQHLSQTDVWRRE